MILPIVTLPDQILRHRALEIKPEEIKSQTIQRLIADMKETVIPAGGIGLAAPQVNFSLRLIVVVVTNKPVAFINPEIINFSWRKETLEEGCLSVPQKFGPVKRSRIIKVKALDENGKVVKFKAKDLFARVVQHEVDHLNGVLFIDRAKKVIEDKAPKI